jgi:hypothetical protein
MEIESTPDSGVDIKNAVVAPLLAPCLRSDTAAGNTPHDHNGIGIPKKADLITDLKRPCPRCLAIEFGFRKTRKSPATSNPNKMYTEASTSKSHVAFKILIMKFNFLSLSFFIFINLFFEA